MQIPAFPRRFTAQPVILILFSLIAVFSSTAFAEPATLKISLRPARAAADQRVPYVDATLELPAPQAARGQPVLKMPTLVSNVVTVAKTLENLSVSDADGPLEVTIQDDAEGGEATYRHWIAARATKGAITVRYRASISNVAAPRGAAPPLELRSDNGAFSGAGEAFLILPETDSSQPIQIHWDLGAMAAGAVGVSSFGKGDLTTTDAKNSRALGSTYFMAGKVSLYPEDPPKTGFFSAWHGSAPFDLRELMSSEEKLYSFYGKFFHRPATSPYGVFLRENPVNAGGGMELSGSFIATFGPKTNLDDLKITLAHEMLHNFV
jgi:hypothetical protein